MKTTMKFLRNGLLIFAVVFASCSKDGEDGSNGAAGLQGEQGITGQSGADGTDGTDGTHGNADVQLYKLEIPNVSSSGISLNFDILTPEVLQENIVLLFLRDGNRLDPVPGRGRVIVPGTDPDIPFNITSRFAGTGNSNISIFFTDLDGAPFTVSGFHYTGLNVFIIKPSAVLSGKSSMSNFSKMSYEEVVAYFGFPE